MPEYFLHSRNALGQSHARRDQSALVLRQKVQDPRLDDVIGAQATLEAPPLVMVFPRTVDTHGDAHAVINQELDYLWGKHRRISGHAEFDSLASTLPSL